MGPETGVASFLLLSILGLVPLLIRSTHGEFVRLLNVQRDAKSQDSTVFHSFFSVALGPFVGFLLFALTMAVRKIAVFGNMYAESIGTILAVVSVLLYGLGSRTSLFCRSCSKYTCHLRRHIVVSQQLPHRSCGAQHRHDRHLRVLRRYRGACAGLVLRDRARARVLGASDLR